ncbi:MAG: hypothetical protein H6917_05445 [Novosphingobium sp.]|nr:hypothetical protein [Novosphingobium sp.]
MAVEKERDWWAKVVDHPYFWFLAPVASALGIPGLISTFTSDSLELAFSIGVIAPIAIIFSIVVARANVNAQLLDPSEVCHFYPFGRDVAREGKLLRLQQDDRLNALRESLEAGSTLILLVGKSGAGKSTLLRDISASVRADLLVAESSMRHMISRVRRALSDPLNSVIAIDQAERLNAAIESLDHSQRIDVEELIKTAEESKKQILLSVRSDMLDSILEITAPYEPTMHYVGGIRFDDDSEETRELIARFDAIGLAEDELVSLRSSLNDQKEVIPFCIQTAGYLVETLSQLERRKHFPELRIDEHSIEVYLELIYRKYASIDLNPDLQLHAEATLFAICMFNRRFGASIDEELVCQATSMPMSDVRRATDFLLSVGVIESAESRNASYFVSHDLISREVIDKEPRQIREDYRVAMTEIISNPSTARTFPLTEKEVNPFHRFFTSSVGGQYLFSLPLISIWIAVAAYGFRLQNDAAAFSLQERVPEWLFYAGGTMEIPYSTYSFFPIFFTLYCWIIFMYGVDRGYFHYIWKEGGISTISYLLIYIAGSIGICIGFLSSVAPAIFPFGVIIPGTLIAIAYCDAYLRLADQKSTYARYCFRFAWQTFLNMTIGISAFYLVFRVLNENTELGRDTENVIIIWTVAAIFSLFAYAMRERQGSEVGRWVLLSVFRASRC